jgi:hypothetical protein
VKVGGYRAAEGDVDVLGLLDIDSVNINSLPLLNWCLYRFYRKSIQDTRMEGLGKYLIGLTGEKNSPVPDAESSLFLLPFLVYF